MELSGSKPKIGEIALTPSNSKKDGAAKNKKPSRHRGTLDQRVVRAMGHPVRVQALAILNERVASPNEISKELGQTVGHVSYHIKVLKECECIELVDTAPRRGAMEHYYRATDRAFLDAAEWASLPASLRPGISGSAIKAAFADIASAVLAGTFDKREDRHISWTPMLVDEEGWDEVQTALREMLERVFEIQSASAERLAKADAPGIPVSVAMMGFEAPSSEDHKVVPSKKKKS
jgi:DNA-binding transcriptional ArsR family regulator